MKTRVIEENGFKETEMGQIPTDWDIVRFGNIADYSLGRTPPRRDKKYWENSIIPWVSIADMKDNYIIKDTKEKVSQEALREIFKNNVVQKNTLLMSFKLTIGRTAILGIDAEHNEAIISIHPKANADKMFLFYYLPSVDYVQYQDKAIKGNTLNKSKINRILVPLPPLLEQQKISSVLSKIQQAIEQQGKILQITKELKKSLMNKLFNEGLHGEEQKETEIGLIPKSWRVENIVNIVEKTKQADPTKNPSLNFKYIDVSGVSNVSLKIVDYKTYKGADAPSRARKIIQTDDVIFATVRPTLKRIAYIENIFDREICSTAFCVLRSKKDVLFSRYLYYCVQREEFIEELAKLERGASYPAITDNNIRDQKIPLPKIEEQQEIANILFNVDKKITQSESQKQTLRDLFKTMLNQLMTGRVRVKNLDIEVN